MARARFDAEVIAGLRARVIAHNEGTAALEQKTRLGELKKVYARNWRGGDPARTALAAVDRHLGGLAKADGRTGRDGDGDGRVNEGGQRGRYADVASRGEDRQLRDDNAGYRSAQTQVIPETRYSLYGPPAAMVAGGVMGGMAGAFPGAARAVGRGVARPVGEFLGAKVGLPLGAAAGALGGAAANIGRRIAGRPSVAGAASAGAEAGAARGHHWTRAGVRGAITGAHDAVLYPAASMARRHAAQESTLTGGELARTRAANIMRRSLVGGLMPGAAYAYLGGKTMDLAGPYLDAAFPRRVEKLAKIAAPADYAEELAKASATAAALRSLGGKALSGLKGAMRGLRPAGGAAASQMPRPDPAFRSAIRAFGRGEIPSAFQGSMKDPLKGRRMGGFGRTALAGAGGLAGAGIAGAAGYGGARAYYRDEDGKFTSRDRAVMTGSAAAVGAAAGVLAGVALGRASNTAFARQVAQRLRGSETAFLDQAANDAGARVKARTDLHRGAIASEVDDAIAGWTTKQLERVAGFTDEKVYAKARLDEAHDTAVGSFLRSQDLKAADRIKDPGAFDAKLTTTQRETLKRFGTMRDDALAEYEKQLAGVNERANAAATALSNAKRASTVADKKVKDLVARVDADTALENAIEGQLSGGVRPEVAARHYTAARKLYGEALPELAEDAVDKAALTQALDLHKPAAAARLHELEQAKETLQAAKDALPKVAEAVEEAKKLKGAILHASHPDAPRIRNPFSTSKRPEDRYFKPVRTKEQIEAEAMQRSLEMRRQMALKALPANMRADIEDSQRALAALEHEIGLVDASRKALAAQGAPGPLQPGKKAKPLRDVALEERFSALNDARVQLKTTLDTITADPLRHWEAVSTATARQRAAELWGKLHRHYENGGEDPLASGLQRARAQVTRAIAPHWDAVVADMRTAGTAIGDLLGGQVGESMKRAGERVRAFKARAETTILGRPDSQDGRRGGLTEWWTDPAKRTVAAKALSSGLGVATVLGLADKAADGQVDLHFRPLREKGLLGALGDARSRIAPYHYTSFSLDPKNHVTVIGATYWEPTSADGKQKRQVFARGQIVYGDESKPADIPQGSTVDDVLNEIKRRREKGNQKPGQKATANMQGLSNQDQQRIKEAVAGLEKNSAAQLTLGDGTADGFVLRGVNDFAQSAGVWMAALRNRNAEARKQGQTNPSHQMHARAFFQRLDDIVGSENTPLLAPGQARDAIMGDGGPNGLFGQPVRAEYLRLRGGSPDQVEDALKKLAGGIPAPIDDRQYANAKRLLLAINASHSEEKRLEAGDMERVFASINTGQMGGGRQANAPFSGGRPGSGGAAGGLSVREQAVQEPDDDEDEENITFRDDAEGRAFTVTALLDAWGQKHTPKREQMAEMLIDRIEQSLRGSGSGYSSVTEKWAAIAEEASQYNPMGYRMTTPALKAAPAGALRKAGRVAGALDAATGAVGDRAEAVDRRGYFEPVRLGGTVGAALGSTAAYTLAEQFTPAPLRAAGFARRLAWRLGASAAGGLAGGAAGEKAGGAAYGAARAPGAWKPPVRPLGEEGVRVAGSWGGEMAGAALPGGIARKVLFGTIGSLAGEEAAGAAYRQAPRAAQAVRQLRQGA